jgi:hypothetical protein
MRARATHSRGAGQGNNDMQLMSFDGVIVPKIMTPLYGGRHRAPSP